MLRLWIRTEASPEIGMGHFMRCFAVAQEARRRGYEVMFLVPDVTPVLQSYVKAVGATIRVMQGPLAQDGNLLAELAPDDWLLLDSYQVNEAYLLNQQGMAGLAILDDLMALKRYDCDLIINPALSAQTDDYGHKTLAQLAMGPRYALVRREFTQTYNVDGDASFVTLTFGGSDPAQLSGPCAQILHAALPDMDIKVISGPANAHLDALLSLEHSLERVKIVISPPSMAQSLAGSVLVVTAAGGSVAEVAAMGIPALVIVAYDNQASVLRACPFPVMDVRRGWPDDLGARVKAMLADKNGLADLAAQAQAAYDGRGAERILNLMAENIFKRP